MYRNRVRIRLRVRLRVSYIVELTEHVVEPTLNCHTKEKEKYTRWMNGNGGKNIFEVFFLSLSFWGVCSIRAFSLSLSPLRLWLG
jgi:hypothetical protein